jgi:hypothetical protein
MSQKEEPKLYTRYPLSSVLTYNITTILHYALGGIGIILAFGLGVGYIVGAFYLVFSFVDMYLLIPLKVCPNCVYYELENSVCISGLNMVSRKIAKKGNTADFAKRSKGVFCPNNLYLAALIIPLIIIIPALILNFSIALLIIAILILGLLLFRLFTLVPRMACSHCRANDTCPNTRATGSNKSAK